MWTLNDKISLLFGEPFGVLEEEIDLPDLPDSPDPSDVDDLELGSQPGMDKRLGITKAYVDYVRSLRFVYGLRDRARAVGLFSVWAGIARKVLGKDVGPHTLPSYSKISELARSAIGLERAIEEREEILEKPLGKVDEVLASRNPDPETTQAIRNLYRESRTKYPGKTISIQRLLNPRRIRPDQDIRVWYRKWDGSPKQWTLSKKLPQEVQIRELAHIIFETGRRHLLAKMQTGVRNRKLVLDLFLPDIPDSDRYFKAVWFTLRNITDELADELAELRGRE